MGTVSRPVAYARAGDRLAIGLLDRLGRSLTELLETVKMLQERQLDLLSIEDKLDTSSAAGELIFHAFGALARFESQLFPSGPKMVVLQTFRQWTP
ncbi:recombinase family protein [Ochrobactrum sp. AN78]|uniref:recombinase family protein n=1 Tax=Ochrobactrum sp. AN78 TaxID=3039853 RepID=UPI002989E723|nr:recombinase family protein [Ochrobactrum sp. AN78]